MNFCLLGTIEVCRDAVSRCDRLRQLRDSYHARVARVNKRMHMLIERLFVNPITRIVDLTRELNISYPTARADVERLRDAGILIDLPAAAPKAFYAPEIVRAAYYDDEP